MWQILIGCCGVRGPIYRTRGESYHSKASSGGQRWEGAFCALERWRRPGEPGVGGWEVEEKESWTEKELPPKWQAGPRRRLRMSCPDTGLGGTPGGACCFVSASPLGRHSHTSAGGRHRLWWKESP